ncbi:MAG: response regulator [Undibacterium sp.]|nr:response regulator [Undibacterium sp.]
MAIPFPPRASPAFSLTEKKVLIIDDMPDMRSTIRSQIQNLGIKNIFLAANVREALGLIKQRSFDVILCDYNLGNSTNGQQFLEHLRSSNIISRATLFIMITAETSFNSVMTAAECMPDDYLLKPFTGETLKLRFERLLERKARLAVIDQLQDKGAWPEIIRACDAIIASKDKFVIDAMRIKGNALLMLNEVEKAIHFYEEASKLRNMPWAKLGLAKAYKSNKQTELAQHLLEDIIKENPRLLAAYDFLGRIHTEAGNSDKALEVLEDACKIAPQSLARHRSIANLAEEIGDFSRVDKALCVVIKQTKNSPLRDTKDFVRLLNALSETGELERADNIFKEAKESFKEANEVRLFAATEAVIHKKNGKNDLAKKALEIAMRHDDEQISAETNLAIAKACLVHGKEFEANQILKTLVQNDPDSNKIKASVGAVLKNYGGAAASDQLIADSIKEVINLNNEAVQKAKAGELTEASNMLSEAALRLPNNLQITSNAALCILMDILSNGFSIDKSLQAKRFQDAVAKQDSQYPRLAELVALQEKIQLKYKNT